ncbi:PadR family transcriptional regulator [Fodinicola feengrottensis]|uniref:PadR family transcriptional regulator n=1 Tax=Fodinicola feengrottensis TaxID=435914 RepID=A0ABP4T721_9ACTN|nr:PadR family transcriptional regulator [Fodinicola feengrottensis]
MSVDEWADLTPTARTILGFVAQHPRSGYDIREAARRSVSYFWGVSDGQLYPQLKLLAELGLIESPQEDPGARSKSVWHITPAGRAALTKWIRSPSAPLRMRDENLVKMMFAAELEPAEVLRLVDERRKSFEWFAKNVASPGPAQSWQADQKLGSRTTSELLHEYGKQHTENALAWCDQVEEALRGIANDRA